MPGVSGLGFLAIKYLRNSTVATYARDMLYSFVESQIMAMPEEQAAAIEALAEGKGSGDTMPITEEEMEAYRMKKSRSSHDPMTKLMDSDEVLPLE